MLKYKKYPVRRFVHFGVRWKRCWLPKFTLHFKNPDIGLENAKNIFQKEPLNWLFRRKIP
jgi:hypothetical protein